MSQETNCNVNICFKSPPAINTANSSGGTTGTITEEHIRASLLSAVEDKVRRRLREQFSQTQAELETLSRTQQELLQGKSKLEDILARLEKEQVRYIYELEVQTTVTVVNTEEFCLQGYYALYSPLKVVKHFRETYTLL